MWLIVGLGNPGKQYKKTRHNIGFIVLDSFLQSLGKTASWTEKKELQGKVSDVIVHQNTRFILLKPQTFMNDSGMSIQKTAKYFKIPPERIIVVHDEKDLPFGIVKAQFDRGSAGHNGIKSTIEMLGTQAFHRIRIGIAPKKALEKEDVANFVLKQFSLIESIAIKKIIASSEKSILDIINTP